MIYKITLATLLTGSAMTPAFAQGFELSAASVELGTAFLTDDGADASQTALKGTAEFAIAPNFAVGASLGVYSNNGDSYVIDASTYDATNVTLHAMYKASSVSSIGLFVATEATDAVEDDIGIIGLEFGMRSGKTAIDVYYGATDVESYVGDDYTFGGMSVEFAVAEGITLGASYDAFSPAYGITEDLVLIEATVTDVAINAGYDFGNGVGINAELGRLGITAADGTTNYTAADPLIYVGFNVKYDFGASGGTLTDTRSFMDLASFSMESITN